MPQLMWGAGDPTAISIEAGLLAYLAASPPAFLSGSSPMIRSMLLGAAYYGYNMFIVPVYGVDSGTSA